MKKNEKCAIFFANIRKKILTLHAESVAKRFIYQKTQEFMAEKTLWKIDYVNLCISEFARKYKLSMPVSYRYLQQYDGIGFLDRNYEAEHILPLQETLKNLRQVCQQNGGTL